MLTMGHEKEPLGWSAKDGFLEEEAGEPGLRGRGERQGLDILGRESTREQTGPRSSRLVWRGAESVIQEQVVRSGR